MKIYSIELKLELEKFYFTQKTLIYFCLFINF